MKHYNLLIKIYILPILIYKKFISPFLGSNCKYVPSCSTYFIESVKKHGIVHGSKLGWARLFRCNKFYMGGSDPVPLEYNKKLIYENKIIFKLKKKSHVQKQ